MATSPLGSRHHRLVLAALVAVPLLAACDTRPIVALVGGGGAGAGGGSTSTTASSTSGSGTGGVASDGGHHVEIDGGGDGG